MLEVALLVRTLDMTNAGRIEREVLWADSADSAELECKLAKIYTK